MKLSPAGSVPTKVYVRVPLPVPLPASGSVIAVIGEYSCSVPPVTAASVGALSASTWMVKVSVAVLAVGEAESVTV